MTDIITPDDPLSAAERDELDATEIERIDNAAKLWVGMSRGGHLNDWLEIGRVLMIGRKFSMKVNHCLTPQGRGYNTTFKLWIAKHGFNTITPQDRAALLWLFEDPEREAILHRERAPMTVSQLARLNTPSGAQAKVKRVLEARVTTPPTEDHPKVRETVAGVKKEFEAKVAHLEEQLAAAETGDGLINLKDKPKEIVRAIVENVTDYKLGEIIKLLIAERDARRTRKTNALKAKAKSDAEFDAAAP